MEFFWVRFFTQREVVRMLAGGRESGNLSRYLERNPLIDNVESLGPTIQFLIPGTQIEAIGREDTTLIEIWLKARELGAASKAAAREGAEGRGSSVEKMAPFLDLDNLKPFVDSDLAGSSKPGIFGYLLASVWSNYSRTMNELLSDGFGIGGEGYE